MAIVVDPDVLIRGEKADFDLHGWVAAQADERFEIAAITVAELWHGVERATGRHRSLSESCLAGIVRLLPVIPYTEQIAYEHTRIWAELESAGKMISHYDLIVGATAL